MKTKVIALLLSVTLFFFAAVPARAAESEDLGWIDIFDYALPSNNGNLIYSVPANSYRDVSFTMGTSFRCYEIDILCQLNSVSSVSWVNGSIVVPLTVTNIYSNIYRISGNLGGRQLATFSLRFTNTTSSSGSINLTNFRISTFNTISFPETAKAVLETQNYSATINYDPDDSINGRSWTGYEDYSELWGDVAITVPDWRLYDYIDIRMSFTCSAILSLSCHMGDQVVPLDQSIILSTSNSKSDFFVTVRIDVRSLSRLSTDDPVLVISFVNTFELNNQFHISSVAGLIDTELYNPVVFWLQKIHIKLDGMVDPIVSKLDSVIAAIKGDEAAADDFNSESAEKNEQLQDMVGVMDTVQRPDINQLDPITQLNNSGADIAGGIGPVLTVPMQNPIILQVLILSFTFALVAYVLYGKR